MTFHSVDLTSLASLLRRSGSGRDGDSEDSDDDTPIKPNILPGSFSPGQIGEKKKAAGDNNKSCKETNNESVSIWNSKEVNATAGQKHASIPTANDPRKVPKYEMYYRQAVTTEDVFLQMGNKTPSSSSCENLVVEIHLPGEEDFAKIQLDLKEQAIDLRSPNHFLYLGLPHPIDTKAGQAKWDQSTEKLTVTLCLARELDRLNF